MRRNLKAPSAIEGEGRALTIQCLLRALAAQGRTADAENVLTDLQPMFEGELDARSLNIIRTGVAFVRIEQRDFDEAEEMLGSACNHLNSGRLGSLCWFGLATLYQARALPQDADLELQALHSLLASDEFDDELARSARVRIDEIAKSKRVDAP